MKTSPKFALQIFSDNEYIVSPINEEAVRLDEILKRNKVNSLKFILMSPTVLDISDEKMVYELDNYEIQHTLDELNIKEKWDD